jgi:hypothetical protein
VGHFDLKYRSHADWEHNLRWFMSSKFKVRYIDLVIAEYADGGFSSQNEDPIFAKDKNTCLSRKYFWKLPFKLKLRYLLDLNKS